LFFYYFFNGSNIKAAIAIKNLLEKIKSF